MFKSKGEIALRTVLELICEHVWLTEHYRLGMPSLTQRIKLAERLERQVSFRQNTLYFDNNRERPKNIPFFNYLLLSCDYFHDEGGDDPIYLWSVHGFHSFPELEKYIVDAENLFDIAVYVKDGHCYQKAQHRFSFTTECGEKVYTDEEGFFDTYEYLLDHFGKWPFYKYRFEICGLCELEIDDMVYCAIIGSLDELVWEVEKLYLGYKAQKDGNKSGIHKTGLAFFEDKGYFFRICIDADTDTWDLYNENLKTYSRVFHSFDKELPQR